MNFDDRDRLLDPTPMALEMGHERLEGGVLHVAVRTDMHGCTGEMFEWWFDSLPGTREYKWWHPLDHISSEWIETVPGTYIGSIHQVIERFTGGDSEALSIQVRDPAEFFDAAALTAARAEGRMSAVICVRGGAGHAPHRTPDGAVLGARLIHVCRDTPWGMVVRSHFFLGQDLPGVGMPQPAVEALFPDAHAPKLLQHCYDEFTFLSRFLPSLWIAEAPGQTPTRPW